MRPFNGHRRGVLPTPYATHKQALRRAREAGFRAGWAANEASRTESGPCSDLETDLKTFLGPEDEELEPRW